MSRDEILKLDLENMASEDIQKLTSADVSFFSLDQTNKLKSRMQKELGGVNGLEDALQKREAELTGPSTSEGGSLLLDSTTLNNESPSSTTISLENSNSKYSDTFDFKPSFSRTNTTSSQDNPFKLASKFEKSLEAVSTPKLELDEDGGAYILGIESLQSLAYEQLNSRSKYFEHLKGIWNDEERAIKRIVSELNENHSSEKEDSEQDLSKQVVADSEDGQSGAILDSEEILNRYFQSLSLANNEVSTVNGDDLDAEESIQSDELNISEQTTEIGNLDTLETMSTFESVIDDDDISVTDSTVSAVDSIDSDDNESIGSDGSALTSFDEYGELYEQGYKEEKSQLATHQSLHNEETEDRAPQQLVELAAGSGIAAGYTTQALKDGPEGLVKGFEKKAELLQKDPMSWVTELGTAQGIADVAISAGTMVAAGPLAIVTIKKGWEEFKHSKHTIKDIKNKIPKLEKNLQDLERVSHLLPEESAIAAKVIGETQLNALRIALEDAKNNKHIGMAEVLSGSAVLAKSTLLGTSKIATIIATKTGASTATMGALGTFAASVGVANLILGPAAGLIAIDAGARMYHGSKEKLEHLKEVVPETLEFLAKAAAEDPMLEGYVKNIGSKLDHRVKFYKNDKRWAVNMMVSGATFGGFSAGSGVVALAALTGLGLASNPVGAGVLAAGVGAGAVYLGVSAAHNYINAPKRELYDKAMAGEAPGIERDFLASLDSLALLAPGKIDPSEGVRTREILAKSFEECDHLVHDILQNNGTGKPYRDAYVPSTATEEILHLRTTQNLSSGGGVLRRGSNFQAKLKHNWGSDSTNARVRRALTIAANLPYGKETAMTKGNNAFGKLASYLTKTEYANKLKDPATDNSMLFEKLGKIMEAQAKGCVAVINSALEASPVSLGVLRENLSKGLVNAAKGNCTVEEMHANWTVAKTIYDKAILEGDKHLQELTMNWLALTKLSYKFKAFSMGIGKPTDAQKANAIEAYMAFRQDNFHIKHTNDPDLGKSFEALANFLIEVEPKIYRLQRAAMPFVETYSSSMRKAMTQSLNLDRVANNDIAPTVESPADLRAKLVECYERICEANMGSDEERKEKLLAKFNKANDGRRAKGKPEFSAEEFIRQKYENRIIKKMFGNKRGVETESTRKVPGKKSFSH